MGLEATWSLVDIPADARDAAQAAARREGLSVGEWLTRRILKRFSELSVREQQDAFVTLRNYVAELADRLDGVEARTRDEPTREALKQLHQGLTRLNDEFVHTAGHSAIQISQLSTSLEALNGRVDELREHDVESRNTFERRMAQLQEFVDGMNLRHSAETRAVVSRVDSLGETLAESRRLIANERSAIERLEENLTRNDARYGGAFRSLQERFDSINESIHRVHTAASDSSAVLDQRIASLQAELGSADSRTAEERQLTATKLEKLQLRIDDFQVDITGMCGALDRRVLLSQQALQSLGSRHAEMSHTLTSSVESVAAQLGSVQSESARIVASFEKRVVDLETSVTSRASSDTDVDNRFAAIEHQFSNLADRAVSAEASTNNHFSVIEEHLSDLADRAVSAEASTKNRLIAIEHQFSNLADRAVSAEASTENRFSVIEQQLSALANRTEAAASAASVLLPKTEAIESRLEQLNLRLENEVQNQQEAVEQLKATLIEQTLHALGAKLEAEGEKQHAAIVDLKNGLLDQLSHAFDERAGAEERKQQDVVAQLQANFANALHTLGETFESESRKQQEAIAELKAILPTQVATAQNQVQDSGATEAAVVEHSAVQVRASAANSETLAARAEETVVPPTHLQNEESVLELTTLADPAVTNISVAGDQEHGGAQPAAPESPPYAAPDSLDPGFELPSAVALPIEQLAPAGVTTFGNAAEEPEQTQSYLSAARQSLHDAAVRDAGESAGKGFFAVGLLKSLPLLAKGKGQATSYALLAGIALVAILAIIVGAAELMNRRQPPPVTAHSFATHAAAQVGRPHAAKRVAAKHIVSPSLGAGSSRQDQTAALAKGGDAQAQLLIGVRYLGRNDAVNAAAWLERAATQGAPVAQYRLATLYASGRGVPTDKAKAFHWYLSAAQAGNRKAMSNLAVAYAEGDGTTKNPQEAGRWFLKAAQLGLADAQFDLAILYERGLGVPQNLTDAYRWYVIAAKSGDKESKDRVEALSSQLTPEDRAAAETAAAEFKPLPMNARANEAQ
jgi:localization factor PodJL